MHDYYIFTIESLVEFAVTVVRLEFLLPFGFDLSVASKSPVVYIIVCFGLFSHHRIIISLARNCIKTLLSRPLQAVVQFKVFCQF